MENVFACLAARTVFVRPFLHVCPKNKLFCSKNHFLQQKSFFASINYLDLHHWQGGMKFATQILPLLN
jgi:hypothetical protein